MIKGLATHVSLDLLIRNASSISRATFSFNLESTLASDSKGAQLHSLQCNDRFEQGGPLNEAL